MYAGEEQHLSDEGWNWLSGMYFMFVSMTTIGFGDTLPTNLPVWSRSILTVLTVLALGSTAMMIGSAQEYFGKKMKLWRGEVWHYSGNAKESHEKSELEESLLPESGKGRKESRLELSHAGNTTAEVEASGQDDGTSVLL